MPNLFRLLESVVQPAPSLLPFLDALERQLSLDLADASGDPELADASFGTLTASRRSAKPFIVGFIPPDNEVNFIPVERAQVRVGEVAAQTGVSAPAAGAGAGQLGPNFWINYVDMCARLGIDPKELAKVLNSESGFKPDAQNIQGKRVVAQGLNQFIRSTAVNVAGVPPDVWDRYNTLSGEEQLPYMEVAFRKQRLGGKSAGAIYAANAGGYRLPGFPTGYMSRAKFGSLPPDQKAAVEASVGKGNLEYMFKSYDQNPIDDNGDGVAGHDDLANKMNNSVLPPGIAGNIEAAQAAIAAGARAVAPGTAEAQALANAEDQPPTGVMAYGVNEDDPLSRELGRPIQLASAERQLIARRQTEALRAQITLLQNTPPLVLLINPKTFNRSYEASSDTSVKGRYGHIVHTWLERPFTIESEGVTAGQYAVDAEGSGGLTNVNRIHSLSYANLLSLVLMYKNNGRIFAGSEADPGIPILAFTIFIYYDEHLYLGSFDSLSVEDSADRPYSMSYSFKFTVRYDRDVTLPATDHLIAATLPF